MSQDAFATFVRRRARELGLTQGALAERAQLSRQSVVKLLSGDVRDPQTSTVRTLARALNVSPVFLFRLLLGRSIIDTPLQQQSAILDDHSSFVGDVTYPNGTLVPPGHRFQKIWDIQNGGSSEWIGRWLKCQTPPCPASRGVAYTLIPDHNCVPVPHTRPGEVVRIAIWLTAPTTPCTCTSIWKLADADGTLFFPGLHGLDCTVTVSTV